MKTLRYTGTATQRSFPSSDMYRAWGVLHDDITIDVRATPDVLVSDKIAGHLLASGEFVFVRDHGYSDSERDALIIEEAARSTREAQEAEERQRIADRDAEAEATVAAALAPKESASESTEPVESAPSGAVPAPKSPKKSRA